MDLPASTTDPLTEPELDDRNWPKYVNLEGPFYGARLIPLVWASGYTPDVPAEMRDIFSFRMAAIMQRRYGYE